MPSTPVNIYLKNRGKQEVSEKEIQEYRQQVRKMGIVNFAKSLPCPPFSQDHGGETPDFIILEPFQEKFLVEILENNRTLLTAGRGAGKTFMLSLLILFKLVAEDYFVVNVIGGSLNQTEILQSYLDFFRDNVPEIGNILPRSLYGLKPRITSRYHSKCVFLATSPSAARGPRCNLLVIDEYCTGESKSKLGAKSLKAATFQMMGRKDAKLLLTSTSDFVRGRFYEILQSPQKFGFKVYRWSTARHVSGKEARFVYTDKNPEHWKSNCWWITDDQIQNARKNSSDSEFIVEVLGGISMASGFVFNIDDLNVAECKMCSECKPYEWGHCKLITQFELGEEGNPIKNVIDRKSGFDYGMPAPCALTIVGKRGKLVFVLFSDEVRGMRTSEIIEWIVENLTQYQTEDFIPDPSAPSEAVVQEVEEHEFSRIIIESNEKYERIETVKNLMEKHTIIVPTAFWRLMKSLKTVCYDQSGKIVKRDDHSFDSLCYACSDYGRNSQEMLKKPVGIRFSWDK
jgi:hypothetical protein